MGRVKELDNIFKENYHGVLTHDGAIKVAKTNITAKILYIGDDTVLVKGNKPNSYHCEIHKDLYSLLDYCDVGDTAFVKFKWGTPWIVGFMKKNADKTELKPTGDAPVHESGKMDWISFFDNMEMEK